MSKVPKKLQDEWDKKLAESGFIDIEKSFQFDSSRFSLQTGFQLMAEQKQSYYSKAWDFLELYDFDSILAKQVWTLHVNGETVRAIAETLKISRSKADRIIQHHKRVMLEAY